MSGGRDRLTILCRAYEAVIGAIYLDQGMSAVIDFALPPLLELLDKIVENKLHIDARSQLQEQVQARLNITPDYRVTGAEGPEHAKQFPGGGGDRRNACRERHRRQQTGGRSGCGARRPQTA